MRKEYTEKQKFIRNQIAKSIIKQRLIAKQLRDYCKYSISKRKLNSIVLNTEYLSEVIQDLKKEKDINMFLLMKLHEQ